MLLALALNPSAPMGNQLNHCSCCFAQGGGLRIYGGTVALDSCSIYENTATYVSAKKRALFPAPPSMGYWAKASTFCLAQNGGAYIDGRNTQVNIANCALHDNTAEYVSNLKSKHFSQCPHGRPADQCPC